jgi:hypothetical protein
VAATVAVKFAPVVAVELALAVALKVINETTALSRSAASRAAAPRAQRPAEPRACATCPKVRRARHQGMLRELARGERNARAYRARPGFNVEFGNNVGHDGGCSGEGGGRTNGATPVATKLECHTAEESSAPMGPYGTAGPSGPYEPSRVNLIWGFPSLVLNQILPGSSWSTGGGSS